ncbi:MAG: hypothetical protein HQ517_04295 [SAR324 cluster bacterium]|nr:hypothetical protein [SAR324 cluster bacterium]
MLKDRFYKICRITEKSEFSTCLGITLNPDHPVYQGHFPANPVTPGVCMIQMVKEVVSDHLQREILLTKARQIKFLNLLTPDPAVVLEMAVKMKKATLSSVHVTAQISDEKRIFFKFSGFFEFTAPGKSSLA